MYLCVSLCNFIYEMVLLVIFVRLFSILSDEYFRVDAQLVEESKRKLRKCCTSFYIFLLSAFFLIFSVLYSLVKPILLWTLIDSNQADKAKDTFFG